MRPAASARPHKRDGVWYLIRRVPKEFADLDRRGTVRVSTNIAVADDPRGVRAKPAVQQLDGELTAYWHGLRDGQAVEARRRFEAARKRARQIGIPYQTAAEIAQGDIRSILARARHLIDHDKVESEPEFVAVMGGEEKPALRLSDLLPEFEAHKKSELLAMSEQQVKKWRNPKARAVGSLIAVVGDKALSELTRSDALSFRRWWQTKIEDDGLDLDTANKDFGHIAKMFHTVNNAYDLGLTSVFSKMRFEGNVEKQRAAFTAEFVRDQILAPGALDGLNEQARDIVRLVAETGLRLSEACNLTEATIHLDTAVPYVEVRPDQRKMKTPYSLRDIPLVGVALEAMRRHPAGFPRYRDKAAGLSALVNKSLRNRTPSLLPTDEHSLYSLRHTFEDRLTAVDTPDKVIAVLMGHKHQRPKYGAGPSLELKQKWMLKIAYGKSRVTGTASAAPDHPAQSTDARAEVPSGAAPPAPEQS